MKNILILIQYNNEIKFIGNYKLYTFKVKCGNRLLGVVNIKHKYKQSLYTFLYPLCDFHIRKKNITADMICIRYSGNKIDNWWELNLSIFFRITISEYFPVLTEKLFESLYYFMEYLLPVKLRRTKKLLINAEYTIQYRITTCLFMFSYFETFMLCGIRIALHVYESKYNLLQTNNRHIIKFVQKGLCTAALLKWCSCGTRHGRRHRFLYF